MAASHSGIRSPAPALSRSGALAPESRPESAAGPDPARLAVCHTVPLAWCDRVSSVGLARLRCRARPQAARGVLLTVRA
eukprot:163892-Hanusia_phi.AAC.1